MSMNSKLTGFLMFAVGAAIGSVVTWKFVKTKYERIANEEIKSVKEVYSKKESIVNNDKSVKVVYSKKEATVNNDKPVDAKTSIYEMKEYLETIKNNGYYKEEQEYEEGESDMNDSPYVISPDEYGNLDDHTCVNLSYYADGVLADDWDTVIIDPDEQVGPNIADHFGEYEDDTVFVRNEKLKVDYEICRDLRTFAEVIGDETIDQSDD